jgi:methylenetetrahydrofolate dehydrogenase (NADP+)/methenyltetrahydrofolate cyclohydrolase
VVVGRSDIVGKPMSALLSRNAKPGNATVTLCHSKTIALEKYTLDADLLVVASGIPGMIDGSMVKTGATVIDVGITRVASTENPKGYEIKGDVNFESVSAVAGALTPVPGGVGLMTICGLLMNTLQSYENGYIKKHTEL